MKFFQYIFFVLLILLAQPALYSQYVPVHPSNQVYDLLTELSNEHMLNISTYSTPLSRIEIGEFLDSLAQCEINKRQLKEIYFYLKDFGKDLNSFSNPGKRLDLLYYSDSQFKITVNPILGGNYYRNVNGAAWHWWNGAEAWSYLGKWAFWGSLRDNHQSEYLTQPDYMNQNSGGANFKKFTSGHVDFWEYRGGISYDFGIGHIALMKDHFSWGSNYHGSNILSGRTPSFPHLNFKLKPVNWFEFSYIHAWLSSDVVDSTRSFFVTNAYGTDYREVYHSKFMAANLFTFKPLKRTDISFGNSIIYDYENPHIAYFIPVMFYKAVDHQLNSGINNMNSQLFFDLSVRELKNFHFYSTLFLDELAVKRILDRDTHNFYSLKTGIQVSNLLPNTYAGFEYTITNALTFRHFVPTTTFESNRYNLGHYLEDNAKEFYFRLGFKPLRNMDVRLSYCKAIKSSDHTDLGTLPRMEIESFTPIDWESNEAALEFNWQIINDVYFHSGYSLRTVSGKVEKLEIWTPEYYHGNTRTFKIGLNIGF